MRSKSAARLAAAATVQLATSWSSVAHAQEVAAQPKQPVPPAAPAAVVQKDQSGFSDRFVMETGRIEPPPADPSRLVLSLHGEYQLRYRAQKDLPLVAPLRFPDATTLGQTQYLYHWLRLKPRLRYRDKIELVGEIDAPRGLIVGDTTRFVGEVRDSLSEERWYEIHPRQLYLQYNSPIGVLRIGQQAGHWGMGILANDGDHPTLFGDYSRGNLAERVLFATTPMGKGTPLTIIMAGDLVFEDNTADLIDGDDPDFDDDDDVGDRALQGVLAVMWRTKPAEIGIYGVVRHQDREREAAGALTPFTEELTVGVVDMTGKFNVQVPGASAFLFGQFEWAAIFGSTTYVRSAYGVPLEPTEAREPERIRSFGAAAKLGGVHVAGRGDDRWGRVAAEVEWGYATGDADPYDGTTRRFTFDSNHNVGLVLFDHVLAWKTARSATAAQDPSIVNRPNPGLQFLPSRGSVFGATYVNPRVVVRPRHWVDLKAGVVIAQTTADLVDPYQAGALGNYANYDGGDERRHDLGVELDGGFDLRIKIDPATTVQLGAEGGVLFPGHAFDDAEGNSLGRQYLAQFKLGLQY